MLFVCMVAILAGILNVHRHFAAPAAAPIVLNIFIIATILLSGWLLKLEARSQLFSVAVAVLLAGVVQIVIQIRPLRRSGVSIRPTWQIHSESFKKMLLLMVHCLVVFWFAGKGRILLLLRCSDYISNVAGFGFPSLLRTTTLSVTIGGLGDISGDGHIPCNEC